METKVLKIEGMTCDGCGASVKKALERFDGVDSVEVLWAEKQATVVFDAGKVDVKNLYTAVEDAGFDVLK